MGGESGDRRFFLLLFSGGMRVTSQVPSKLPLSFHVEVTRTEGGLQHLSLALRPVIS